MKPTGYLDFYNSITNDIFNTYKINEYGVERYHVKHRAFLLFKLTVFLDEKRGKDYLSQLFTLKRVAVAYMVEKHHFTIEEMKEFALERVLLSLFFDLQKYNLPQEIRDAINNSYPVGSENLISDFDTKHVLGPFHDSEWDPDYFDLLKRKEKQ
ncbi:TPA: hypothetical protein ACSTL1_003447 [Serratia fonticola]